MLMRRRATPRLGDVPLFSPPPHPAGELPIVMLSYDGEAIKAAACLSWQYVVVRNFFPCEVDGSFDGVNKAGL